MGQPAVKMPTHELQASALRESFKRWGLKDKKYKPLYKKLDEHGLEVVNTGLGEIARPTPANFNFWWTLNHMRFRQCRGTQQRLVHELTYNFLSRLCKGDLSNDKPKGRTAKTGSRANKTDRHKGTAVGKVKA